MATAQTNEPSFDYLPGNIHALALAGPKTRNEAALWNNLGLYCPTNVSLSEFKPVKREPIKVTYDLDLSLRRALALSKLQTTLQLEPNEVEYLRRVSITIDAPKAYSTAMSAARPRYVDTCLDALASRSDLYKLRSVIVGTVTVDFTFKENVSLIARLRVLGRINGTIGFGAVRSETYSIVTENVVFGAKVQPVTLDRRPTKPLLVSSASIGR